MQSITTAYFGHTARRGARVKAEASGPAAKGQRRLSVTLPYDDTLTSEENHHRIAAELARRLHWYGCWVAGAARDNTGNVYVRLTDRDIPVNVTGWAAESVMVRP